MGAAGGRTSMHTGAFFIACAAMKPNSVKEEQISHYRFSKTSRASLILVAM